jgi:hypothetical protein
MTLCCLFQHSGIFSSRKWLTADILLAVFHDPSLLHQSRHFSNAETIIHTYLAMKNGHHKLLEVIDMIHQQFSSNENKKQCLSMYDLCSV